MALPLVQLVNALIPKVARDVQLINFLGTISETFCVSLLQMRVHHIEYTKHEVILKKKKEKCCKIGKKVNPRINLVNLDLVKYSI